MDHATIDRLIDINRRFYQHFAVEFDRTRTRLQPGVAHLLKELTEVGRILDLGMGNGNLFRALLDNGFTGHYTGLDFSPALVQIAAALGDGGENARFEVRDLSAQRWDADVKGPFDRILAFAALHHLPDPTARPVLKRCHALLADDGRLLLSCWQFDRSERWQARIQPWDRVGLDEEQIDRDDYLLDWRAGGVGLRYVHLYKEESLARLASETGYKVLESFYSDGHEGDLGLYQVWGLADA